MYQFNKVYIFINDINDLIFTNIEKISIIHIIYNSHDYKSDKFVKLKTFALKK